MSQPVSPGFRLRPSLSGRVLADGIEAGEGVAGVQTPAFVERLSQLLEALAPLGECRRGSDSGLR